MVKTKWIHGYMTSDFYQYFRIVKLMMSLCTVL